MAAVAETLWNIVLWQQAVQLVHDEHGLTELVLTELVRRAVLPPAHAETALETVRHGHPGPATGRGGSPPARILPQPTALMTSTIDCVR